VVGLTILVLNLCRTVMWKCLYYLCSVSVNMRRAGQRLLR